MRLKQNILLPDRGLVDRFNVSIVNASAVSADDFSLETILRDYKDRNLRLEMGAVDYLWKNTGNNNNNNADSNPAPFVLEGRFQFPEERVFYRPGVAQLLKWAWIQYLSIFAIFYFVVEQIKSFVFLNQIIPTIVESRWDKIKRH